MSSIGLTEHIGVAQLPGVLRLPAVQAAHRRAAAQPLHHPARQQVRRLPTSGFIDRYVFPDGELTGSGRIITEAQDAGLEVLHEENLRQHYALTLRDWCANLVEHWDEAVAEVGLGTARVWGLYMAGSRLGFERNIVQLHQVLAVKLGRARRRWTCRCGRGGSRKRAGEPGLRPYLRMWSGLPCTPSGRDGLPRAISGEGSPAHHHQLHR